LSRHCHRCCWFCRLGGRRRCLCRLPATAGGGGKPAQTAAPAAEAAEPAAAVAV